MNGIDSQLIKNKEKKITTTTKKLTNSLTTFRIWNEMHLRTAGDERLETGDGATCLIQEMRRKKKEKRFSIEYHAWTE